MIKILFLIHDLGQGGAEKVLVNLVNHMDCTRFDISVIALFGGGVNEQFLDSKIHYKSIFPRMIPGNSKIMKLFSPSFLHKCFIKDKYDIEISYLEGSTARIVSGCSNSNSKLLTWVHCTMRTPKDISRPFRNIVEAKKCYNKMDKIIFVSEGVCKAFVENCDYKGSSEIVYNTADSSQIIKMSMEAVDEMITDKINLITMGTLKPVKGFDRLLRVIKRLCDEKYPIHLYLLGVGPQQKELEQFVANNSLSGVVTFLGYKTNPYRYMAKASLYICSSYSEGYSTAVTEALILGIPVCTVNVSGMNELLGNNNEYGVITENSEEALYQGIKKLLENKKLLQYYKKQARYRGNMFEPQKTVKNVENLFINLLNIKSGEI